MLSFVAPFNHIAEKARYKSRSNIPDVLVFAKSDESIMNAVDYTAKLVKNGIKAQFSDLSDENEARAFAEKLRIKK